MSLELVGGLLGLAALDALNPATIAGVALLLLAPIPRPEASAAAFVTGAYLTVLAAGALGVLAAGAAVDGASAGLEWLRRVAFGLAALLVLRAGFRRLRTRTRPAVRLPRWISPASAAPLGVLMTGADLPNAFPYLIAIERLIDAGVSVPVSLLGLAGYALVYVTPCVGLLAAAVAFGPRVRVRLQSLHARLGSERVMSRSPRAAAGHLAAAVALVAVGFTW